MASVIVFVSFAVTVISSKPQHVPQQPDYNALSTIGGGDVSPMIPVRGWNSWDPYKQSLNESTALRIAENMARLLLPHGYNILVIDGGWSDAYNHDTCPTGTLSNPLEPCIDSNGRMQPNVHKWPSSRGGKGLKPFIDKVHKMGLKVGMHTLQSTISKAALAVKSPVLGAPAGTTVNDIVGKRCSWQKWGYGVDLKQPAGQQWLDSVYAQFADWGLDFIKYANE